MRHETLTAQQYRNHLRLARYHQRLADAVDPLDHAVRTRKGMRVVARLHRLIRSIRTRTDHALPTTY